MGRRSLAPGRVSIFGGQERRTQSRTPRWTRVSGPHCRGNMFTDRRYFILDSVNYGEPIRLFVLTPPKVGGPQVNFTMGAKTGKQRDEGISRVPWIQDKEK